MKNIITGELPFNELNGNGRKYMYNDVVKGIASISDRVNDNIVYGELGHPSTLDVSMLNTSHVVTGIVIVKAKLPRKKKKMYIKSRSRSNYNAWQQQHGKLIATAKIIDTKMGRVALPIAESLCLSPRGTGMVNENNEVVNFKLHTFDLVQKNEYSFNRKSNEELGR